MDDNNKSDRNDKIKTQNLNMSMFGIIIDSVL